MDTPEARAGSGASETHEVVRNLLRQTCKPASVGCQCACW